MSSELKPIGNMPYRGSWSTYSKNRIRTVLEKLNKIQDSRSFYTNFFSKLGQMLARACRGVYSFGKHIVTATKNAVVGVSKRVSTLFTDRVLSIFKWSPVVDKKVL